MVKMFIECIQPKDKSFFNFYIFFLHGIIEPKQLFCQVLYITKTSKDLV